MKNACLKSESVSLRAGCSYKPIKQVLFSIIKKEIKIEFETSS